MTEDIINSLLKYLKIDKEQAAILVNETTNPPTIQIYIFSKILYQITEKITKWQGYSVSIELGEIPYLNMKMKLRSNQIKINHQI